MKYTIIGERELVLGFALVGVGGTVAATREEALDAFYRATGRGNVLSGGTPVEEDRAKVLILTEEVASMIVYIASPLASATTGAALRVDGGVVKSAY